MSASPTQAVPSATAAVPLAPPEPIYNCPSCSHYLPPGTLACPECQTIIYSGHLRSIAMQATAEEQEQRWPEAQATWALALDWLPPGTKQADAVHAKIAAIESRQQAEVDNKAKWTKRLGPFAPVVFYLAKIKSFLFVLLKLKFLLNFVAFFAIYCGLFGIPFGVGLTLSIVVHEMGHYVAARRRGLKVDLPVFLPGLGAYVRWYSQGVSLETLSGIALAGPIAGLLFALVCGAVSLRTGSPLFAALAHVSGWLNVLNLIPVFGLDGDQATYALDRTQRWLVLATALIFAGLLHEPIFLLVAVGMVWRLYRGGYAPQPSTSTLLKFVLLLFALGLVMLRFPPPPNL